MECLSTRIIRDKWAEKKLLKAYEKVYLQHRIRDDFQIPKKHVNFAHAHKNIIILNFASKLALKNVSDAMKLTHID